MENTQFLLKRVETTKWKYDKVLHQSQHMFNIFSILRDEHDEVNLHSLFLAELLNPKGTHEQGNVFLRKFLDLNEISEFQLKNTYVKKEYKNIDILIANDTQAIILENKIYAEDQPRQLARYYKIIQAEGFKDIFVIYLTLDGNDPSRQSIDNAFEDDILYKVSYKDDVNSWLDECLKEVVLFPVLRETIVQYQRLTKKLTGQTLIQGYIMEVTDLLLDEKNIELATDISQALVKVRQEIQYRFWEELKERLVAANYDLVDLTWFSYTRSKVEKYDPNRNNRKFYGIAFRLCRIDEVNDLFFYIKINLGIYYGFAIFQITENTWAPEQDQDFNDLAELIQDIDNNFKRETATIGWKFPNRRLNFGSFTGSEMYNLASSEKRGEYLDQLVEEISIIVNGFNIRYSSK
jgi:hypothetical protein